VAELDKRARKLGSHNYIVESFLQRDKEFGNYYYYRCTHKTTPFRVANAYDTERRRGSGRYGGSPYYFALPEEIDDLIAFVEHDEQLYYAAYPDKKPDEAE